MAGNTIEKSKKLYSAGQPMTSLHLITQGRVQAEYPGGTYQLSTGDVIGICEICSEIHLLSYTTLEETTMMTFPLNNMDALNNLLQKRPDIAKLFALSLFRQLNAMTAQISISEMKSIRFYHNMTEDYEKYTTLCKRYNIQPRTVEDLDSINAYPEEESTDVWTNSYYLGMQHIYAGANAEVMLLEPGLTLSILWRGSLDFSKTYPILDEQYRYLSRVTKCYFNDSGNDLFELLTNLYCRIAQTNNDPDGLSDNIERMILLCEDNPDLDNRKVAARVQAFRNKASRLSAPKEKPPLDDGSVSDILQQLSGSLEIILDFAYLDRNIADSFRKNVKAYKATSDKNSTEDACSRLRKKLTEEFNILYASIFERTIDSTDIPMPVKMFLYFGYVDEELAGADNSVILYRLVRRMEISEHIRVYTFYDWLKAVYNGSKSPSRSDLDEDYHDFIMKQKKKKNLNTFQVAELENNSLERIRFELRNMFPTVNKVTFGRITTFCPLFTKENVLKDLNASFVTPESIDKALEKIRGIDYSAFYRESVDHDNMKVMGKEPIHVEFLPDVILMPNIGIKGTMWQEIEGKKRNSPSRMIVSIFHMEDINTTLVRLTGEFRWELCKRIQGGRWNDITDASLTSEYFDYLQFFRKSNDLSKEAKEKLVLNMQRARNSFKEMFVRDYIIWVLFESSGSARLNKVARRILFTYCPFPACRDSILESNPMYQELIQRRKTVSAQRVHHLNAFAQKLRSSNTPIPQSLEKEIRFASREID